jgi:hypothetical protein
MWQKSKSHHFCQVAVVNTSSSKTYWDRYSRYEPVGWAYHFFVIQYTHKKKRVYFAEVSSNIITYKGNKRQ